MDFQLAYLFVWLPVNITLDLRAQLTQTKSYSFTYLELKYVLFLVYIMSDKLSICVRSYRLQNSKNQASTQPSVFFSHQHANAKAHAQLTDSLPTY